MSCKARHSTLFHRPCWTVSSWVLVWCFGDLLFVLHAGFLIKITALLTSFLCSLDFWFWSPIQFVDSIPTTLIAVYTLSKVLAEHPSRSPIYTSPTLPAGPQLANFTIPQPRTSHEISPHRNKSTTLIKSTAIAATIHSSRQSHHANRCL